VDGRARTPRWKAVAVAAAAALGVAVLGGLSTDLGDWYAGLHQPAWKPPDAWFGPAWTLIYALTAMAGVTAWRAAPPRRRVGLLAAFALNAFLNVFWSLLFFRLHRPDWALAEVLFLWASILLLMVLAWRFSRTAAVLLLPYLLWVAFAGWLNLAVVRLNGPF
jgi:tryptophan-rich sensory protein